VTVRQALSHRAGVLGVDETLPVADLIDSSRAAAALASTTPAWDPGSAHGYHAITIGVLMEELARRVTGRTLQSIYETDVRAPRDLDFYLGLPLAAESRYRAVASPTAQPEQTQSAPTSTDGIQSLAFNALHSQLDLATGPVSPNNLAVRAAGVAAVGGVGSARGLAGVYAATLDRADPLLSNRTIDEMSREHSFGLDRVLGFTTSFGVAFMKAHPQMDFASYRAFGHDGAGGALGFADPLHELAFGYIPHPMQPPGGADPKAIALSQLVRRIIRAQADASHLTPAT
jgi:CubicO group peptidase (beta-lactamase class C family)